MSDKDNFDNNNPFSGITPEQVKNTEEKTKNLDLPKNENSPTDIKTLGDKLKALRLEHSFSIEQLADTTRIRSEFLIALEENDFSRLPGLVFAKGFIKNLARFYKIKDKELIELFQASSSSKSEDDTCDNVFVNKILSKSVENSTEFPPDDITHKKGNILNDSSKEEGCFQKLKKLLFFPKYILLFLLILLISGIAVYFIKIDPYTGIDPLQSLESTDLDSSSNLVENDPDSSINNENISNTDNSNLSSEKLSSATEVQQPTTSNTNVTVNNNTTPTQEGIDSTGAGTYVDKSVLKIFVKSSTSIRTKKDSSSWEERVYEPGEYSFDFKNVFHIFIENSSLVQLSINDVNLGDLSNKGIERRLTFYHNKELPIKN